MTPTEAKKLILDLIDAGHDGALVQHQDGGMEVDIVLSRKPGRRRMMTLKESEERMDAAIRAAWQAMMGSPFEGDPVEFINS